ncbi:MAG TPA: ribosome biogenesis factor YjgA [Acidobacteriota bacterium]|nr:ribosome biogenesis factor YjgA [Acidobacteriota bacterium]HQF85782.1 ribosome biogenesis factor YjgA [Acidobacteriota bacterium]HQG90974.1 ribosome biogenesis factor YjgA [Acidobacteriota bacterium]HQK89347.1 ribosome biogenesis factor YjgA [Acidobacteriota bacterium]
MKPKPSDDPRPPSRSQRKREVQALDPVVERVLRLDPAAVDRLGLPEPLRLAIGEGRRISAFSARRRHQRYLRRLLLEPEAEPLRQLAAQDGQAARREAARFHWLEEWRERLVAAGDPSLDEFLAAHPTADRQELRRLVLAAQRERRDGKPAGAGRALFRRLRAVTAADLEPPGDEPD